MREDKYAAASVRGHDYKSLRDRLKDEPELVILFDDSYKGDDIRKLVEFGDSLAIPVKYGIKNIKRIGLIRYTDERPKDFWAQQGYDWFAGL